MLKKEDYDRLKAAAAEYFKKAGIVVTEKEMAQKCNSCLQRRIVV